MSSNKRHFTSSFTCLQYKQPKSDIFRQFVICSKQFEELNTHIGNDENYLNSFSTKLIKPFKFEPGFGLLVTASVTSTKLCYAGPG